MPPDPPDPAPATAAAAPRRGRLARRLPLVVILIAAVAGAVFLRDRISFDALAAQRETLIAFRDAHYLAAAAGFVLAYAALVALSLPGAAVATLTGGFLFGTFPGVLYNILGAGTGATLIFLAVRAGLGRDVAARLAQGGGAAERLVRGLQQNEWSVLFLMRLVPVVPFFVANLLPAFTGVALHRFAVTTFLGILPGALVYTSVGAGLSEVFARGERPDLSIIFAPPVLLPLLGLSALAALPIVIRAIRGTRA